MNIRNLALLAALLCSTALKAEALLGLKFTDLKSLNQLVEIDGKTGVGTVVASNIPRDVSGLAYSNKSKTLYGLDSFSERLFSIDVDTGASTYLGRVSSLPWRLDPLDPAAIVYDDSRDRLIAYSNLLKQPIAIDPATASVTLLGSPSSIDTLYIRSLAYHRRLDVFFGATFGNDAEHGLITLDIDTGEVSYLRQGASSSIQALTYSMEDDALYGIGSLTGDLVVIDPTTGVQTAVGATGFSPITGLVSLSLVPEPGGCLILGVLLVIVSTLGRASCCRRICYAADT